MFRKLSEFFHIKKICNIALFYHCDISLKFVFSSLYFFKHIKSEKSQSLPALNTKKFFKNDFKKITQTHPPIWRERFWGYVNSKSFRKSNETFRFRLNKHTYNGVHRIAKMWDAHAAFFDFLSSFPRQYSNCISISNRTEGPDPEYGRALVPGGQMGFWKIENWPSHDSGRPCARSMKVPWPWMLKRILFLFVLFYVVFR